MDNITWNISTYPPSPENPDFNRITVALYVRPMYNQAMVIANDPNGEARSFIIKQVKRQIINQLLEQLLETDNWLEDDYN